MSNHAPTSYDNHKGLSLRGTAVIGPWIAIAAAWSVLLFAYSTQRAAFFDHDYLLRVSHLPWLLVLFVFLLSWQCMIAAMMFPTLLVPFASLGRLPGPLWRHQLHFAGGYAAIWTLFALVTFVLDTLVHWLVSNSWWWYTHSWLIGVGLLVLAGIVQLSPLKRFGLARCHNGRLCPHGEASWQMGMHYGGLCFGSCWAIMLAMFGLGMRNLFIISLLTGGIVLEQEGIGGKSVPLIIGCAFLLAALGMIVVNF